MAIRKVRTANAASSSVFLSLPQNNVLVESSWSGANRQGMMVDGGPMRGLQSHSDFCASQQKAWLVGETQCQSAFHSRLLQMFGVEVRESMTHAARYQDAVEALARPLTRKDGVPARAIAGGERRLAVKLPAALREYYLAVGQFDQLNRPHNRLYRPDEWFVGAGKLAFMEENQVVVFWAVEAGDPPADDPPVFQGVNVRHKPIAWYREHERCSEFLVVMLYWQAVNGGLDYVGLTDISSKQLAKFRAGWQTIGRVGQLVAFGGEGRAACVVGEGKELQLFVGTRTHDDFKDITAELGRSGFDLDEV